MVNTTFVNFQDNEQRGSGALSWLLFTGAGVTTENTVKSAKFINAKPVYFPKIDPRFDSDNRGGVAYRTLAIHDLDGSTTGIPDSYVLLNDGENDSVATDDTCEIHPTWNASVCKGDIGRIQFRIRRAGPTRRRWSSLKDAPSTVSSSWAGGCSSSAARCSWKTNYPEPQWQGLQDHGQSEHCARRYRDPCEDRKTEVSISLSEMAKDSWVVFELPGFANATSGKQQDSIDALRKATETSYFKGPDAVWVKLVIPTAPQGIGIDRLARWILKPAFGKAIGSVSRTEQSPRREAGVFVRRIVRSKSIFRDVEME